MLLVDPEARRELAKISVGVNGHEVAVSPDSHFAYVPIYGNSGVGKPGTDGATIDVIDIQQHKLAATIELGKPLRPHQPTFGPDGMLYVSAELANAVAITQSRNGEERTDGMAPTPGTAKCDSWYQAHGLPPTYKQPPLAGNACDQLWMLKAAFESSPQVGKDALAAGLQAAGSIDFSYPEGPNTFAGDGVTTGGQFWRVAQFFTDCKCWKVIDPDFHPTYG